MRIAIVGAGAIGCLFGARLENGGHDVLLVHRNPKVVASIRRNGVRLRSKGRDERVHVSVAKSPADLNEFELIIFAVKAYDTEQAARVHRIRVGQESSILTLQNGLGNVEILARVFRERRRVLAGSTTEGSLSLGLGSVVHTGTGKTWIGELDNTMSERCKEIVQGFRRAGLKTEMSQNITGVLWSKAVVNAAINATSGLTRLPNGSLLDVHGVTKFMLQVVREGVAVARAKGVSLDPADPGKLLTRVLKATGSNRSSMLQDVEKGKRTEIRQLNGAIADEGKKLGVPTPVNEMLTCLVLGLEHSKTLKPQA